ncbi:putative cutinase 3 [Colletotrichum trifolii]|uniref:cutinase n=1 Tax=Colletotrichum trifolii TaxID=5466 RepID=A0A4R8RJ26_COLTR|nr:putative cutinase 3 [Colletotrichum trifolii]
MKISTAVPFVLLSGLAPGFARVTPRGIEPEGLLARDNAAIGLTENEVRDGACKESMFLYFRGSTQTSNMGEQPGPQLASYLRWTLTPEKIAIQGIEYPAKLSDNICLSVDLCHPKELAGASDLVRAYMNKCPGSTVVMAGYSQGGGMLSRVIGEQLESQYKDRIVAAVTFGNIVQADDHDRIPNFVEDKAALFCNRGDPVCENGFLPGAMRSAHQDYKPSAKPAAQFMVTKIASARGWPSAPVVPDIDLTKYANTGLKFLDIFRGAAALVSTPFNDADLMMATNKTRLISIFGRGDKRVDMVGVKWEGGDPSPPSHGGDGGDYNDIWLGENEFWTTLEVCNGQKNGNDRIGYFRATTSTGQSLELGSKTTDVCTTFAAAEGMSFVGMYGESGDEVDSLGPIEYAKPL